MWAGADLFNAVTGGGSHRWAQGSRVTGAFTGGRGLVGAKVLAGRERVWKGRRAAQRLGASLSLRAVGRDTCSLGLERRHMKGTFTGQGQAKRSEGGSGVGREGPESDQGGHRRLWDAGTQLRGHPHAPGVQLLSSPSVLGVSGPFRLNVH